MTMETLEFVIYPDGRVLETVTGIVGKSCQEVTAAIEAQLGRVVATETTADYYATVEESATTVTQQQTDWGQW
ncbi:MAG: DUF2997 domain-containing protein [Spirulina sp. DLM2.Bin59]|nr:MAG: DUF2997 domain-containing protein [Spirulina sp. DLM2.Bin59]